MRGAFSARLKPCPDTNLSCADTNLSCPEKACRAFPESSSGACVPDITTSPCGAGALAREGLGTRVAINVSGDDFAAQGGTQNQVRATAAAACAVAGSDAAGRIRPQASRYCS